MIKVNFKEYFGAKICRAQNDVRYYLNGFYFDKDNRIVSTDGHRMFVGKIQSDEHDLIVDVKGKEPVKFDYAVFNTESLNVTFHDKNNDVLSILKFIKIDGRYPDWRRVANIEENKISEICLNFDYLSDAAKIGKKYGNKCNAYLLTMQSSDRAVKITFSTDAYMIVMPCKV